MKILALIITLSSNASALAPEIDSEVRTKAKAAAYEVADGTTPIIGYVLSEYAVTIDSHPAILVKCEDAKTLGQGIIGWIWDVDRKLAPRVPSKTDYSYEVKRTGNERSLTFTAIGISRSYVKYLDTDKCLFKAARTSQTLNWDAFKALQMAVVQLFLLGDD